MEDPIVIAYLGAFLLYAVITLFVTIFGISIYRSIKYRFIYEETAGKYRLYLFVKELEKRNVSLKEVDAFITEHLNRKDKTPKEEIEEIEGDVKQSSEGKAKK